VCHPALVFITAAHALACRAQCSGRVASSHSLDLDEDPGAGSQHDGLIGQPHMRSWQSEPQV
jgi:hypothetical protein